jgi:hypothetical protein
VLSVAPGQREETAARGVLVGVAEVRVGEQALGVAVCRQGGPDLRAEPLAGQLGAEEAGNHFRFATRAQHKHDLQYAGGG